MKSKLILATTTIAVGLMTTAFTLLQQPKPWPVPAASAKMANPQKSSKETISEGKALWATHCSSCHGKGGLGDGSKAAQLKTTPDDLTKAGPQGQSDGALFYKISEGRDDMPSFKKKLPEQEDIWNLVVYIRTLKK